MSKKFIFLILAPQNIKWDSLRLHTIEAFFFGFKQISNSLNSKLMECFSLFWKKYLEILKIVFFRSFLAWFSLSLFRSFGWPLNRFHIISSDCYARTFFFLLRRVFITFRKKIHSLSVNKNDHEVVRCVCFKLSFFVVENFTIRICWNRKKTTTPSRRKCQAISLFLLACGAHWDSR